MPLSPPAHEHPARALAPAGLLPFPGAELPTPGAELPIPDAGPQATRRAYRLALLALPGTTGPGALTRDRSWGAGELPFVSGEAVPTARARLGDAPALRCPMGGSEALLPRGELRPARYPKLGAAVWAALDPQARELLTALHRAAVRAGGAATLVGGAVRDALLGVPSGDLDVVLTGAEPLSLVPALEALGLRITAHPDYGNLTARLPGGDLDVVRARCEAYPQPGQPPQVAPAGLLTDLARRDFTVNTLALRLGEGGLHAAPGALRHLRARQLVPLHARSLRDDPSRLLRAARLAARLGFDAHGSLTAQVPHALAHAPDCARLWQEVRLLLAEPRPAGALAHLDAWGAGGLLPPALPLWRALEAGETTPSTYAAALLHASDDPAAWALRLGLGKGPLELLARARGDHPHPPGSPEGQLRALLFAPPYPPLTGSDLLALGFAPGPAVGRALARLAELRRTGGVGSREHERTLAVELLQMDTAKTE